MNRSDDSNTFVTLFKETLDGLGRLMAGHLNLARVEFLAELKSLGRQFAIMTIAVTFISLGYALTCLGLAVVLSRWLGFGGALFLLGGLHLVGGATALLVIARKRKLMHLMQETKIEANKSVSTLSANILNGSVPNAAISERESSNPPSFAANTSGEARIVNSTRYSEH